MTIDLDTIVKNPVVENWTPDRDLASGPVLMQKGMLLRVTVNPDGGVRTSIDHNVLHDLDERDLIFVLGCLRQLEHKVLTVINDRDGDE